MWMAIKGEEDQRKYELCEREYEDMTTDRVENSNLISYKVNVNNVLCHSEHNWQCEGAGG